MRLHRVFFIGVSYSYDVARRQQNVLCVKKYNTLEGLKCLNIPSPYAVSLKRREYSRYAYQFVKS
jgi:hypothetical protein